MQEFNIVTTFAEKHKWGHDMVTSCEKYLPSNCTISVYLDQELPEDRERVKYFKLPEERIRKFKEWFMPIKNSKIPPNVECNSDVYNKNLYYFRRKLLLFTRGQRRAQPFHSWRGVVLKKLI